MSTTKDGLDYGRIDYVPATGRVRLVAYTPSGQARNITIDPNRVLREVAEALAAQRRDREAAAMFRRGLVGGDPS